MDAAGFGNVVGGLLLGEVGDVTRHRCRDDEGSSAASLEVVANSLGTVKGSVQISLDNLIPCLDSAIEDT